MRLGVFGAFVFCLSSINNTEAVTCSDLLKQFTADSSQLVNLVVGNDSRERYSLSWDFQDKGGQSYFRTSFNALDPNGDGGEVIVNFKSHPVSIKVKLPQNPTETGVQDYILFQKVLEHLFKRAPSGTKFEIVVEDPTVIDSLNSTMNAELSGPRGFIKDAARRVPAEAEDYRPDRDSFIPGIRKADGIDKLHYLKSDSDFFNYFAGSLEYTQMGKAIKKSGSWKVGISFDAFDYIEPDFSGVSTIQEKWLGYHYIIELEKE